MVDEHDPAAAEEIFAAFVENDTWYVPTHLTRWVDAYADDSAVRQDTLLRYLHPLMKWQWLEDVDATVSQASTAGARQTYRDFYHKGLELAGAAHQAGVEILAGTDYIIAGADVHRELVNLVIAGLSPAEALRTATLNPAHYFGLEEEYGSIEPGKTADLLLLEASPLQDSATRSESEPWFSTEICTIVRHSTICNLLCESEPEAGRWEARSCGASFEIQSATDLVVHSAVVQLLLPFCAAQPAHEADRERGMLSANLLMLARAPSATYAFVGAAPAIP